MKRLLLVFLCLFPYLVNAKDFISPSTKVNNGVAITLDACGGTTDLRILNLLIEKKIPSTLFVTGKWLKNNSEAINLINQNKNLFSIQNHGTEHKEAILSEIGAYHLPTVKNKEGLNYEINSNLISIKQYFPKFPQPEWYRTAGALYDQNSINFIKAQNFKIAGYTIAVDEGGTSSENKIYNNIINAKNGDVLLLHINKPNSHIYEGLNNGLINLLDKHITFTFLE